ncbi:MAG TPA: DUF4383 domain-containing protein [Solirubrobacterales bacterium]|nr:DUF4383 domain-containing protein [Solirubrobacterales bacterium]
MDGPSPARLYATLLGAILLVWGILGFFYSASFGSPGEVEEMLGTFAVNGWSNALHILSGALGLFMAGYASRPYSLVLGLLYAVLAAWGFALGDGNAILDLLPVDTANNILHLVLGTLGVAAALATPGTAKRSPATA